MPLPRDQATETTTGIVTITTVQMKKTGATTTMHHGLAIK